jgi:hypothetical protein
MIAITLHTMNSNCNSSNYTTCFLYKNMHDVYREQNVMNILINHTLFFNFLDTNSQYFNKEISNSSPYVLAESKLLLKAATLKVLLIIGMSYKYDTAIFI